MAPPNQQPSQATPLPLAAGRAALSNRISLLLAGQSSILKTMNTSSRNTNPFSRSQATATAAAETDQEANFKSLSRDNEGVGYVDPNKSTEDTAASKRDQMLRNKLLGKRKANGQSVAAAVVEEEDDDEGRSGLGKRKRPRKRHVQANETLEDEQNDIAPMEEVPERRKVEQGDDEAANGEADKTAEEKLAPETTPQDEASSPPETKGRKKKKKKKRKKNKLPSGATESL